MHRTWQSRRVIFSSEIIALAKLNDEVLVDKIRMVEIESIVEIDECEGISILSKLWKSARGSVPRHIASPDISPDGMNLFCNSFKIETADKGHNCGRPYYFQCSSKQHCAETVHILKTLVKTARFRSGNSSCVSMSRLWIRKCMETQLFKAISAVAIVAVNVAPFHSLTIFSIGRLAKHSL